MDAVDHLIALLDALDVAHEDMEEDDHDGDPLLMYGELDNSDAEAMLGAPEQHPSAYCVSGYRRTPEGRQTHWSDGRCGDGANDGEAEPGYDLPEGDDERDGGDGGRNDNDSEPSLGSTMAINQERWAAGDANDNELVNEGGCDNPDAQLRYGSWGAHPGENPVREVLLASVGPSNRETARDALRHVEAICARKSAVRPRRDPDEMVPVDVESIFGNLRVMTFAG